MPVDLPLVLDDVAGLQLGAGHVGTLIPVVGGVIGQRAVRPVEHGDVLQRHVPGDVEGLVILQRGSHIADALLHGVFPHLVIVGVEPFVDLHVRLLDAGVGAGGEVHAEVGGEIPTQAERSIPQEVVAEGEQLIAAAGRIGEVSQLDLVVIAGHGCLEADVAGHIVE